MDKMDRNRDSRLDCMGDAGAPQGRRAPCTVLRMDDHGERLTDLDQRVRKHGNQLAAIEECHNRLNPDAPLAIKKREK